MTTETHFGHGPQVTHGAPSVIHPDAFGWILAAVDHHRELMLTLDADERFVRLRRSNGNTASMFESPLRGASVRELAGAIVRWAPTAGLSARVHTDSADTVRVSVVRASES